MYSEILNRLDEETSLHNLTPRTCKAYRESVLRLLKYTGKDPKELTDDDARAYLLHKQQSGIKARTFFLPLCSSCPVGSGQSATNEDRYIPANGAYKI